MNSNNNKNTVSPSIISGKYNVKVMSSGSGYTDPSVMITNGNQKYCFSMGNGIHRQSLGSSHSKPQDSDVLFLTHLDPTTETDLLNFILRNKVDISIIGPNGTTSNINSYRHFLSKRFKTFYITECSNDENYHLTDGHISVYPVVIKNSNDSGNNNNNNNNNNNGEIKTLPFSFNKSYDLIEKTSKESLRVAIGSVKSFYDWTILRGGILHGSTGSKFTMGEIEQYAAYRLLKIDIKAGNSKCGPDESLSMYKPKNSKEIKKFLLDTQDSDYNNQQDSNSNAIIPQTEKEKEFWCMESRHFRLVTRLTKSLRLSDKEKREMVRKRMNIYLKDTVYGPINSHSTTFPKSKYSSDVLCFIVHFPDIIGKFSLEKANEFGIVGIGRSKLCKGESVHSDKVGRLVTPDEVLSPSTIGPVVIIIACPRIEYLESIINNKQIQSYSVGERSGCIFHMVPEEIFSTPEYCNFVEKFSSVKWQHFTLNKSSAYHELIVSSAKLVNGLNEVAPMFYTPLHPYSESEPLPQSIKHMTNVHRGRFRQTVILNPLSPNGSPLIDNSACIENQDTNFIFEKKSPQQQLSPKKQRCEPISSTATIPIVKSSRNEFIKSQNQLIESLSDRELEVVFLGTCCSQSSLFRDETCILLNMFDKGSIIFDTGGGSYSQLYRKYGKDQTNQILAGLRFIFISHMHADHHQNLQKLIQARHDAMEELYVPYDKRSLVILSPPGANGFIKDIEQTQTIYAANGGGSDKTPQPWKYVSFYNFTNYQSDGKFSQFLKKELGIVKCQAVSVIHSFGAHGISITSENGWKLSYSGDTAFCKEFNQLSENSTLVIHEATFHDCQQEDADSRRHCTISDAIRAFNNTNSHSVILTHFSQRYPNIQKSGLNNGIEGENISFAFDFLSVNIKNLNHLPNALDTLKIDQSENQVDDFEDIS